MNLDNFGHMSNTLGLWKKAHFVYVRIPDTTCSVVYNSLG